VPDGARFGDLRVYGEYVLHLTEGSLTKLTLHLDFAQIEVVSDLSAN
jgi:hypothetical protein